MKDAQAFASNPSLERKAGGKFELHLADKDSLDFNQEERKVIPHNQM